MCDSPRMGCAWRTTPIYMWCEQARCRISIVACSHSVKLCALAARPFQSQQSGTLIRMWWWWQVQSSQIELAICSVHCKKVGMLLQPINCCCIESVIHHERDARKEQHINKARLMRTSSLGDLYCCLLPQCEALRTWCSSFPIATRNILLVWPF